MMLSRRLQDRVSPMPASPDASTGGRGLVPTAQFDEMLGRAFATMAAAAPERTPPPSSRGSSSPPHAVFYVDVDRFDLTAAGLSDTAIECALGAFGRRLASWAGRAGAVTRRGDDHFVLLCRPGSRSSEPGVRGARRCEYDGDACERALADLRRHVHRPMLIAGRRVCVSGHVDVVDVARARPARCESSSTELC